MIQKAPGPAHGHQRRPSEGTLISAPSGSALAGRRLVLGAAMAFGGLATGGARAAERDFAVDLKGSGSDVLPRGFIFARTGGGQPGDWRAQPGEADAGGPILAQVSADPTDNRFPLAIYNRVSGTDVDVSVRFKAVAGRVDRAAGLAVRLLDVENYYIARANALEDNVTLYRVVKGVRQEIKGVAAKVPSGVWHSLGLKAVGTELTVSFNGKALFTATDRTFASAGKIGLWTKADSVTQFSSLAIKVMA